MQQGIDSSKASAMLCAKGDEPMEEMLERLTDEELADFILYLRVLQHNADIEALPRGQIREAC